MTYHVGDDPTGFYFILFYFIAKSGSPPFSPVSLLTLADGSVFGFFFLLCFGLFFTNANANTNTNMNMKGLSDDDEEAAAAAAEMALS